MLPATRQRHERRAANDPGYAFGYGWLGFVIYLWITNGPLSYLAVAVMAVAGILNCLRRDE